MNKNPEQEAIDLCIYWEKGFNERNIDICIEAMHFPHVRLWKNTYSIFYVAEDFIKGFSKQTSDLEKEGWGKTITSNIKAIQSSEDKVHITLHQSRRDKNNKEYHNFVTLWIVTKINDKWGIQFRSSFLEGASQVNLLQ
mgnify:CR=1 FL=1|tara:strand:- start:2002 stop:2418 length:417 start_codon:yes stop_codon:yes gene_type:complete